MVRRSSSPLLHDYKSLAPRPRKKPKALQWFIVGLGLPLAAVAMLTLQEADEEPVVGLAAEPAAEPAMVATEVVDTGTANPNLRLVSTSTDILTPEIPIVLVAEEPEHAQLEFTVGRGDTMEKLFRRNALSLSHLAQIAALDEARQKFRRLRPGDEFTIEHDGDQVVSMYSELDLTSALSIRREDDGFVAEIVEREIETRKRIAHAVITNSLFESATAAGLSDRVVMNIAGIFAWDIDFVLDIRRGDDFFVQYEEIWQDGKYVTDGEIIAAEFNNDGRRHRAIRFIDDDGISDYFTPDGDSVRRAFMRNPVDARVSSRFNPQRLHPVLKTIRPHRGVDYGAPHGTPIKSTGDGKIIFRGKQRGYGNVVIVQHGGNISTLYAHMSSFARNQRVGTRVRQGQVIGFVGATGLVTGAHLHYEYRVNGVHRNPRTVDLPQADPIDSRYRERFLAEVGPIIDELERYKNTQLATVAFSDR